MGSYLVIARKWRPNLFDEIVGQGHVTRTLKNAVSSGRIHHAYIFSGPRGVGKTTAARILAKGLNCVQGPTPSPCNRCETCVSITKGSSVDVFEIDGASNTGVENVRELRENVRYVPAEGRYKIYIIDEVHMLSQAAFNALLKTLEEPPPKVVFIFATTEVHKVPLTILSRCQRFDFKRIPFRDIYRHLDMIARAEGIKVEERALFAIVREAEGSLRDAQSLLDQVIAFAGTDVNYADVAEALGLMDRALLFDLAEAVVKKDGKACLNIVEKVHDFGYDLKKVAGDLLEFIRDLTVLKVTGDSAGLELPDSEIERLKTLSQGVGIERLQMLFATLSRGFEEVARSTTPRFSLEMALLKASRIDEVQPVSELIARLEGLREKIETSGCASRTPSDEEAFKRKPDTGTSVPEGRTAREATEGIKEEKKGSQEGSTALPSDRPADKPDLIGFIKRKDQRLVKSLESAAIASDGTRVDITASKDSFGFLQVKKDLLESICGEFFKRPVKVNIKACSEGIEKQGPGAGAGEKEADPFIKEALRIFGGKVIEDRRRTNV